MDVSIIGRTMLKHLLHFYDDFFIFVFLNSYYCSSKLLIHNKYYYNFKLKIFGRTKDSKAHKMKIKGISVQGGVDYSLIKM